MALPKAKPDRLLATRRVDHGTNGFEARGHVLIAGEVLDGSRQAPAPIVCSDGSRCVDALADAQQLLARVEVRLDAEFSARYPQELNARITVHTKDGRELKQEKRGYEGSLAKPMAWDRVVEKFHWLSEAHADAALRGRIIEVVQTLDERPLSDLMSLFAAVKPVATYATVHPGIQ